MSQLSGFGQQSMSPHFRQMESGLEHQHNSHQMRHQGQISSHQQQATSSVQQPSMAQISSRDFLSQGGGVPSVKIIEQPAGNKLRFR